MDVVSSISNAVQIAGKLHALSKKIQDVEFNELLADLRDELSNSKLEAASLKEAIANLKTENLQLKAKLGEGSGAIPDVSDGAYVFPGDPGHFCTACFDVRKQRVRVSKNRPPFDRFGNWSCPSCEATFG
jgi:hypothetical protein